MALLVAMDRYRAYVVPGEAVHPEAQRVLDAAAERAREHLSEEDHPTLDVVCDLVLGRVGDDVRAEVGPALDDLVVRFQQTCGPVMAKGIEDTAFYRWHRLVGLNEVGADPDHFAESPDELTVFVERLAQEWPLTMTTLSTHDTKRSEDLRARLSVVSERPEAWQHWVREAQEAARPYRSKRLDGATEYLLWQTLVGAWPVDEDRLQAYATKAVREAKMHTGWSDPDEEYEAAVAGFVSGVLQDERLRGHVAVVGHRDGRRRASGHPGAEAAPARAARHPRRLPGHRARRPLARRPRQPAAGRLPRPRRATGPSRRRCGTRRPRRREASRHQPGTAAAA